MTADATSTTDDTYMKLALRLAQNGQGHVEPNPMVGAVLVHKGKVVGKGWHKKFGGPHAEIEALNTAKTIVRGATLYVNLEPCCHTGKTGPCTKAIMAAGIGRVVVAMRDPNPLVAGKGIKLLRKAGIRVDVGILETEARELNRPFIKWITTHQPYVIAKWAQTLDGCIADSSGQSRWISSQESRELVHELRGRMDGIVAGIGTALADDPMLTARPELAGALRRTAARIIIDNRCRLPLHSNLVKTALITPTIVIHKNLLNAAALRRMQKLSDRGVQCLAVGNTQHGDLDLAAAWMALGKLNCTNILIEGGPKLLGSLLKQNLIDEGMVFIAPKIAGDQKARYAVEGLQLDHIKNAIPMIFSSVTTSGPDVLLRWRRWITH